MEPNRLSLKLKAKIQFLIFQNHKIFESFHKHVVNVACGCDPECTHANENKFHRNVVERFAIIVKP